MGFLELVKRRRTVRRYKPDPVPRDTVQTVLEAARLAPSWGNNQCWKFVVVTDEGLKVKLARTGSPWIAKAPVIIVGCADPTMSVIKGDQRYYMVDAGIAMEHMVLAATELQLGTCWVGSFDEKAVKDALKVPEHVRVVAMLTLGYADEEPSPRPRKALNEIVRFNEYT